MKDSIHNGLRRLISWSGYITLGTMCILIGIQVLFRYVFNNALAWPEEMARYAFLATAYCSIAYVCASNSDGHLRIEILPLFLSNKNKRRLNFVTTFISASFFAFSAYITFQMLLEIKDMEMQAMTVPLPYWWLWVFISGSMLLSSLFSFSTCWQILTEKETANEVSI